MQMSYRPSEGRGSNLLSLSPCALQVLPYLPIFLRRGSCCHVIYPSPTIDGRASLLRKLKYSHRDRIELGVVIHNPNCLHRRAYSSTHSATVKPDSLASHHGGETSSCEHE